MSYLVMPHTKGWTVMYKEMKTFPAKNGRPEYSKEIGNACFFRTKEEADKKAEELKQRGCKIDGITECIF